MTNPFDIKRFTQKEDGSLLVFFLISILSILGVFALSFDMGRRASTQTDMQSFADNVALAAAGELDGSANAIDNAKDAATSVIIAANEQLKAGTGVAAGGLTITFDEDVDLVFYTTLPDLDRPSTYDPAALSDNTNADYKYRLPTANTTTEPTLARFVGVTLNTRNVDWLFGGAVTDLTNFDSAIGAIAIAGNAGYTCEIAPVMVCLPRVDGVPVELDPGIGIQLQTVGQNAAWNPGEFGYLDVSNIPGSAAGACDGVTPESRFQACLLAQGISACFNDRGVDIQTGQRGGQEPAGFNLPFGIFGQAMNNLRNNPIYAVGPHTVSGQTVGNGNCRANGTTIEPGVNDMPPYIEGTMPFPPESCLPDCSTDPNFDRFGDGVWNRSLYNAVNYTIVHDPASNVDGDEIVVLPGDFFDFPASLNLTRHQYYLLEIARAENGGSMVGADLSGIDGVTAADFTDPIYGSNGNDTDTALTSAAAAAVADPTTLRWDDFWDDAPSGYNPILPDAKNVAGIDNGLPSCGLPENGDPDRRVIVFAGIDCPPGALQGNQKDVPVVQYYEAFMMAPARDSAGNTETFTGNGNPGNSQTPIFELFLEVIQPIGGEGGGSTAAANTAFREMVQLYR